MDSRGGSAVTTDVIGAPRSSIVIFAVLKSVQVTGLGVTVTIGEPRFMIRRA